MKIINIKGCLIPQEDKWIYDWFEYPYTCAEDINRTLLEANGEDIEVIVNSPGGSVYVGSEIYTSLKDYPGKSTGKIVGIAASAASVAIMGVDECLISPTAQMMIHNASTQACGDYREMDKTSEVLQTVNKSILNAYKLKTGLEDEEIKNLMDQETWFTAEQAKEKGLVDEIMFQNKGVEDNSTPLFYNSLPMPGFKAIEEMRKCGSIANFKEKIINKKQFTDKTVDFNKLLNSKGGEKMDLNTLKNEHKDIYDEIVSSAVEAERKRIKDIEDLAMPGNEDIINSAKFETGITAEQVAVQIIKNEKEKGKNYLNNVQKDVEDSNVQAVQQKDTTMHTEKEKVENEAKEMAAFINKKRGL